MARSDASDARARAILEVRILRLRAPEDRPDPASEVVLGARGRYKWDGLAPDSRVATACRGAALMELPASSRDASASRPDRAAAEPPAFAPADPLNSVWPEDAAAFLR